VLDDAEAWERPVDISPQLDELVAAVRQAPDTVVLVSAEVGLGVVPETSAGRLFRDELGALNAALVQVCDEVVLLVAGLPLRLK
jgi:adenosylcobinamide kinase / adenosylcobinamide-phosphate guanylyltransferase